MKHLHTKFLTFLTEELSKKDQSKLKINDVLFYKNLDGDYNKFAVNNIIYSDENIIGIEGLLDNGNKKAIYGIGMNNIYTDVPKINGDDIQRIIRRSIFNILGNGYYPSYIYSNFEKSNYFTINFTEKIYSEKEKSFDINHVSMLENVELGNDKYKIKIIKVEFISDHIDDNDLDYNKYHTYTFKLYYDLITQ